LVLQPERRISGGEAEVWFEMNAVEIEEAISALAEQPFDAQEFPFTFLQAFGNKETTLKRLRKGETNKSDLGGVLQTSNIHIAAAAPGEVTRALAALKASPATAKAKARFIVATDGTDFEAEDLDTGETVACAYAEFPDHFGFFLPLAGITTVKQVRESSFDIRATSRMNRLYVELLKDDPDWGTAARRHDMNHFMARLIFCFFAERTDIFHGIGLFTDTISRMSAKDSSNTHEVIGELFRAMNTKREDRDNAGIPRWADAFPYVNGELFSGSVDTPRFSKIARSYLLHIGSLDWTKINPDIFGSMIQAVAEDEERGALGMHYTSVPNILKVLNPLFLDDLRARLKEADNHTRKLLNLILSTEELRGLDHYAARFVRPIFGAQEFINGVQRYCLWIGDGDLELASQSEEVKLRLRRVSEAGAKSEKKATKAWSKRPHRFVEIRSPDYSNAILVPRVSSEERLYLPVGLLPPKSIVTEAFALYDSPLWSLAIVASRLHLTWIATVCGQLETRYRYSNTLGWNTFPVPTLTEKNKADLTRCAEDILLAREAHFPATIADLYDPDKMPANLREAHERNDDVLERIYIGRRFRNDTERLEKLFELYTKTIGQRRDNEKGKVRANV